MSLPRIDPVLIPRLACHALAAWMLTIAVADPDLWGHTRFGLDMLASGRLAASEPYSFTSDRPWINHEWLAELFMGAAYAFAGGPGLAVLKFALVAAAFLLVSRELARRGVPPLARDLLVLAAVLSCLTLTRTVRPQAFSLLLFAGVLTGLRAAEDGRARALAGLPVALALWANLHGGWLVGAGVIGVWTGLRTFRPVGVGASRWATAGALSVAATLLTPEGPDLWRFLWQTVGLGRADISEWQPLWRLSLSEVLPWLFTTPLAAAGLWRMRPRVTTHMLVVAMLMILALRVMRLGPFYTVAVVMLCGPHLAAPRQPRREGSATPAAGASTATVGELAIVVLLAAAAIGASAVASYRNLRCVSLEGAWLVDLDAGAALAAGQLRGRLLTWFDWGEYAIWHLGPALQVSMDGRRETVYSDQVVERHHRIYYAGPGWEDTLADLAPDYIWLPNALPVTARLEALGWRHIYRTPRSTVFGRGSAALPAPPAGTLPQCFPG